MNRSPLQSRFYLPALTYQSTHAHVRLHAGSDDEDAAEIVLTLFARALEWVERELEEALRCAVDVFLYPTNEEFAAAFGCPIDPTWLACPMLGDENLLVLQSPRTSGQELNAQFRANLVHEAGHILFNQKTGNDHSDPEHPRWPMWLEEGVCGTIMLPHLEDPQGEHAARRAGAQSACRQGLALPLAALQGSFSCLDGVGGPMPGPHGLAAYDISYLAMDHLLRQIGTVGRNKLLAALQSAHTFEPVLIELTGMTTAELDIAIRRSLEADCSPDNQV